jgi:hypothetical protein
LPSTFFPNTKSCCLAFDMCVLAAGRLP